MNNCPLCDSTNIIKAASSSLEVYCGSCRNILVSKTLGFKFASDEGVEACSRDGLPGWKGPGSSAKCYTYDPGDAEQEKRAKQKAGQSSYMEQRRLQSSKIVEAIPFFTEAPSKIIPDTIQTEDGVEVGSLEDVGSGRTPLASKFFHPTMGIEKDELEGLGRAYCTSCGRGHEFGSPCN